MSSSGNVRTFTSYLKLYHGKWFAQRTTPGLAADWPTLTEYTRLAQKNVKLAHKHNICLARVSEWAFRMRVIVAELQHILFINKCIYLSTKLYTHMLLELNLHMRFRMTHLETFVRHIQSHKMRIGLQSHTISNVWYSQTIFEFKTLGGYFSRFVRTRNSSTGIFTLLSTAYSWVLHIREAAKIFIGILY